MNEKKEKILLGLLPFWSPLIPPIGIASLKAYLQKEGYNVKTVDATTDKRYMAGYEAYFDLLRQNVPEDKKGNFFSIGHDVLRNQMMAHLNHTSRDDYARLIKILVKKTFYTDFQDSVVESMIRVMEDFYSRLEQYVLELMEREQPGVFGLSVFSDTLPASLYAFKLVREKYPHIKTYMGGGIFADHLALNSPNLERFLEKTQAFIDKIIVGEGENIFLKALQGQLDPSKRVYTMNDIDWQIMDLGSAEILDLSDFNVPDYPFNVSYTSRSCPFQCSFCSETVQWGKYRKKKSKQIVKEVIDLYRKHRNQLFLLSDSLLNPVMKELPDEFLNAGVPIYWEGWLRVDKNSRDTAHTFKWRRSGFYQARMGIESGSPRVLEIMNKKITVQEAKESLVSLALAGIKTTTLWVVGHPGETEEDFQQTLDFLEEMKDEIYEAECRPFYYYLTGQAGSENENDDWFKKPRRQLYPPEAEDMLMLQTWILDCEPTREESYSRMNRFVAHCKKLGIPNPYSLHEIYEADKRWERLQKNAVPHLMQFRNMDTLIDECRDVKELMTVSTAALTDVDDFEF